MAKVWLPEDNYITEGMCDPFMKTQITSSWPAIYSEDDGGKDVIKSNTSNINVYDILKVVKECIKGHNISIASSLLTLLEKKGEHKIFSNSDWVWLVGTIMRNENPLIVIDFIDRKIIGGSKEINFIDENIEI